jgi:hypothetical protein
MGIRNFLLVVAVLALSAGVGTAGAVSGPGANDNSKFVYTEAIERASSNLTVSVNEGGQKRLSSVDYRLSGTAITLQTLAGGQAIGQEFFPVGSATGLVPDADGRVSGSISLEVNVGPGSCTCGGSFRVDYTDLVLTNLATGHTYRLADVSLSTP